MKDMRADFQKCLRFITGKKYGLLVLADRSYTRHDPGRAIPKGNAFLQLVRNTTGD